MIAFLLGFPRSGTTWLGKVIGSHPEVTYRHEPFGRDWQSFGPLYHKLKHYHGLSDADHAEVRRLLLKPSPVTEKPPFFRTGQHAAWIAARCVKPLAPLYAALYRPKGSTLLVKETRSDVALDSILKGARADKIIILVRHPYAVIASHLRGIRDRKMPPSYFVREEWKQAHDSVEDVHAMSEVEYLALTWRVQNEAYLAMGAQMSTLLVNYDALLRAPEKHLGLMLQYLGLPIHPRVSAFLRTSQRGDGGYFSVFKKPDPEAWMDELEVDDVALIDQHTRGLVQTLGLQTGMPEFSGNRQSSEASV